MTARELIRELLDLRRMDEEVLLCIDKEFVGEDGLCKGYVFRIDKVRGNEIVFTDWRDTEGGKTNDKDN